MSRAKRPALAYIETAKTAVETLAARYVVEFSGHPTFLKVCGDILADLDRLRQVTQPPVREAAVPKPHGPAPLTMEERERRERERQAIRDKLAAERREEREVAKRRAEMERSQMETLEQLAASGFPPSRVPGYMRGVTFQTPRAKAFIARTWPDFVNDYPKREDDDGDE
jgi:hypothetical protein